MPARGGLLAALSVKQKLIALFGCIVAGFCLVFMVEFLATRFTDRVGNLERLAVATKIEVLEMRRQEKNFFLRHDTASRLAICDHQQAAVAAAGRIRDLDPAHAAACGEVLHLLGAYRESFEHLAGAAQAPEQNTAAERFLEASQALESLKDAAPKLSQALPQLRRLEKHWLANANPEVLTRLEQKAGTLLDTAQGAIPPAAAAVEALEHYRLALDAYARYAAQAGSANNAFVTFARGLEPVTDRLQQFYAYHRQEITHEATFLATGLQAAILLFVAIATWTVFRSVSEPLAAIGRHARHVARGEASHLDPADFSGEFRGLAEDIGRMETHLLATIVDLARKEREAAEEAKQARQARTRAEELGRVKSNFLSLVSHELKTPLTSMIGFAQVLLKRLERGPFSQAAKKRPELAAEMARYQENLGIMLGEGRRLSGLIENVLELAALESGGSPLDLGAVTANEVVNRAMEPFREAMGQKGLCFFCEIPSDLPPLRCDGDRLVYVLRHLFSNALKFTADGHIACRVTRAGEQAVIRVEDTGCGIPPEMREAVFEKFLQLGDNLTDKMPGLGIGLAAARAVIEFHGGSIHIAGEPGKGSTVTITMPLAA